MPKGWTLVTLTPEQKEYIKSASGTLKQKAAHLGIKVHIVQNFLSKRKKKAKVIDGCFDVDMPCTQRKILYDLLHL